MLTIETGQSSPTANAYVSLAETDSFATAEAWPAEWSQATEAAREAAIRQATRYIDTRYGWHSAILESEQALSWPRGHYFDSTGRSYDGGVPTPVKEATMILSLAALQGKLVQDPTRAQTTGAVSKKKLDVLELGYHQGRKASSRVEWVEVDALLIPRFASGKLNQRAGQLSRAIP